MNVLLCGCMGQNTHTITHPKIMQVAILQHLFRHCDILIRWFVQNYGRFQIFRCFFMHVVLIFSMCYFSPSMPYLPRHTISPKNSSLGGDPCPTPCGKRSPCDRLSPGPGESFTCDQRKIFVWFEMMYWLVVWNMAGL